MCGILGLITQGDKPDLNPLSKVLGHRGPDGSGFFQDDFISLVHCRLSIIDLSSKASQPFYFKNWVLIFNGEIYNYREIAKLLTAHGYDFTTESDTEVVIKAFDCWKEKAVDHFIGMFAFAIYDQSKRDVYLFRDRMGVKPLYYSLSSELSFGSELKVFKALGLSLTIDPISLHQYFRFGYTPGERTIFREVKKILPGQYLKYSAGVVSINTYWTVPTARPLITDPDNLTEQLETLLISAFKYRLVADVPVGLFLSGGIDSSLVATLLQHHSGQRIKTFTVGFDQQAFDETPYARQVADRLGTEHVTVKLEVSHAQRLFHNFYEVYDEPFADTSGIPTALVSQVARQHGAKVVLSADGADELFGGYPHYQNIAKLIKNIQRIPHFLRNGLAASLNALPDRIKHHTVAFNTEHRLMALQELLLANHFVEIYEARIANQAHTEINQLTGNTLRPKELLRLPGTTGTQETMMRWDLNYFLPDDLLFKVDRATMYNNIEGREPFLDHRVVEFAQRLPLSEKINNGHTKHILRKILTKYHPASLFNRPKQGFSIPIFSWFSNQLDGMFEEYLNPAAVKATGLLNEKIVEKELNKYRHYKKLGKQYNIEKMWRMLSFMMWHQRWMK